MCCHVLSTGYCDTVCNFTTCVVAGPAVLPCQVRSIGYCANKLKKPRESALLKPPPIKPIRCAAMSGRQDTAILFAILQPVWLLGRRCCHVKSDRYDTAPTNLKKLESALLNLRRLSPFDVLPCPVDRMVTAIGFAISA